MSRNLVVQHTDIAESAIAEQAKQLPAGCDFFKELAALHKPHAEAATEAFRQDWVAKYEKGEIKIVNKIWLADDGTEYKADKEGWNMEVPSGIADYFEMYQSRIYTELFPRCAMLPITDTHREFIVICHARRLDTEEALVEMVNYFEEFAFLREYIEPMQKKVNGVSVEVEAPGELLFPIFRVWKRAFSYLRPTHSRWPNQKFGELWREAKTAYAQARMLEYSGTRESVIAGLAEAVQKAQDLAKSSTEAYFDDRVKTLITLSTALHKILRDEKES